MTVQPLLRADGFSAGPQPTLRGDGLVLRPWRTDADDAAVAVRAFADPAIARWHVRTLSGVQARRGSASGWRAGAGAPEPTGRSPPATVRPPRCSGGSGCTTSPSATARRPSPTGCCPRRAVPGSPPGRWRWCASGRSASRGCTGSLEHSVHNAPSCRVAAKAGFALEGTERSAMRHADGWHDMHLHARLASDPGGPDAPEAGRAPGDPLPRRG